jgi:hypothetical protein
MTTQANMTGAYALVSESAVNSNTNNGSDLGGDPGVR